MPHSTYLLCIVMNPLGVHSFIWEFTKFSSSMLKLLQWLMKYKFIKRLFSCLTMLMGKLCSCLIKNKLLQSVYHMPAVQHTQCMTCGSWFFCQNIPQNSSLISQHVTVALFLSQYCSICIFPQSGQQ